MPLPVWLCLAFLILVTTTSLISIFRAGLRLWRTFRSFGKAVDGTVAEMTASAERLAAAAAALGSDVPRLDAARERLRVTLARYAVLRTAVNDVQVAIAGVTTFYPRK